MLNYWLQRAPAMGQEAHFGDRLVASFQDRPSSFNAMLRATAARLNEAQALVCGAQQYSWGQLDRQVAQCAAGLLALGLAPGDRVALLLGNRAEFVIAFFAIIRLGAIAVPLSVRGQTPEFAFALNQCGAKCLLHESELTLRLPGASEVPLLHQRIAVGEGVGPGFFDSLFNAGEFNGQVSVEEDDTATILYTSGTTGKPKGAMLSHLGLVHAALQFQLGFNLTEHDRCIAAVPLSHVTGLIAMIATMACCGGALIILPAFKAADFLALAAKERMTYTLLVPAMYNLCLLQPDFGDYDLSDWRVGGYGGAPMPAATILRLEQKLPKLGLMNVYGATETTSAVTIMPAQLTRTHGDSVGLVLPCAQIAIMDEDGCEVASGNPGEIWIKGPIVINGYWDNPAASAEAITAGWWRSGDIGAIGGDGFVFVLDRKKDMINRGGYKIYTAEVEAVLAAHDGILESAVVAAPCAVLGERVHAFVALCDTTVTAEQLRDFCAKRLAGYKVPESYVLSAEPLPRNANGKILKRQLRERLLASMNS